MFQVFVVACSISPGKQSFHPSTSFDWNSEWKPSPWLPRPCSENSERKELARRRTQTRLLLTLRALHVLQVHQVLHVHHHLLLLHVFHPFLLLHRKYSPASWSTLQCWSLPKGQRSCNAVFKTNNSFGLGQKCYLDVISINISQKVFLPLWREPWPVVAMALILRKLDNNGCGICFHVTDVGTTMMSKCHALLQPLQLFPCVSTSTLKENRSNWCYRWWFSDKMTDTLDHTQGVHQCSVAHHLVGRLTN